MRIVSFLLLLTLLSCQPKEKVAFVESLDPTLEKVLAFDAEVSILADGFQWSEGPLWVASEQMLLFSDVPKNVIHKWTAEKGLETYLSPSGYTKIEEGNGGEGSNALLLSAAGELVICQHGDRRMAVMQAPVAAPTTNFVTLADRYDNKRLNSPNDAVYNRKGDLFFTDPPYGFAKDDEDPTKELSFNGVYKLGAEGTLSLLVDSLTRPNGITFIDDSTLLIANSDKNKARWYVYTVKGDSLVNGRIFYDATQEAQTEKGLPDGLKINKQRIIFATGPGGVWIFDTSGKVLGKIKTSVASANCALGADEKELFITAHNYLLRVALK